MEGKEMTFLEHLEELRWHLIRSVVAILIGAIICFIFKKFIFDVIIFAPKDPSFITYQKFCEFSNLVGSGDFFCTTKIPMTIINRKVAGQFNSHMWVSIIGGMIIAFPYIVFEIWRFIKPGLSKKENRYSVLSLITTSILFALGVLFGYYLITPLTVNFFANYSVSSEISNEVDLFSFVSTISTVVLVAGVIFQLPLVVFVLTKLELISSAFLKKYRKHALVIVLVLSAVITPPDIFSQVLISIPIFILYEASIIVSRFAGKKIND